MVIDGTTMPAATISGFGMNETIDLASIMSSAGVSATLNSGLHQIDVTSGASTFVLNVDPAFNYTGDTFGVAQDGNGIDVTVLCFVEGTRIATPGGEVAVETLRPGDLVATVGGPAMPVRWLGVQTVATRFADALRLFPVRLRAGALADNVPSRDLLLSPGHALLLEGALVQAGALVNGSTIARVTEVPERWRYYHVELDAHALLLAEGAAAESFLDGVELTAFDNAGEREARETAELPYPRIKSHRQVPAALRDRIAARARLRAEVAGAAA